MVDDALKKSVMRAERYYIPLRSIVERLLVFLLLIPLSLLLMALALWIRIDSRGPAVFKQTRAGRHGRPFQLYKFRTMRTDVDPYGDSPQSGHDPRITRAGRRLREWSLDELPQLINVLLGHMSLVGPRPLYVQQMAEWNERQRLRLLVKPGLTGLAQVSGRGALTIEEKLELDVQYVERIGFLLDIKIMCRTVLGVFRRADIYEVRYSKEHERRQKD